jgi:hypothetical protein
LYSFYNEITNTEMDKLQFIVMYEYNINRKVCVHYEKQRRK